MVRKKRLKQKWSMETGPKEKKTAFSPLSSLFFCVEYPLQHALKSKEVQGRRGGGGKDTSTFKKH